MIAYRILSLVGGYLFGLFQTSYIYGRMNGIDIREHGSGNAGTTNALRVLGKKAGIIVFFGDLLKATVHLNKTEKVVLARGEKEQMNINREKKDISSETV